VWFHWDPFEREWWKLIHLLLLTVKDNPWLNAWWSELKQSWSFCSCSYSNAAWKPTTALCSNSAGSVKKAKAHFVLMRGFLNSICHFNVWACLLDKRGTLMSWISSHLPPTIKQPPHRTSRASGESKMRRACYRSHNGNHTQYYLISHGWTWTLSVLCRPSKVQRSVKGRTHGHRTQLGMTDKFISLSSIWTRVFSLHPSPWITWELSSGLTAEWTNWLKTLVIWLVIMKT